jgi:hypothetical protein
MMVIPPSDRNPPSWTRTMHRFLFLLPAAVLIAPGSIEARPPHKAALASHFGPTLARKLNDCATCHLPAAADKGNDAFATEKPHNPFGVRMKAVRLELLKAGKPTDISARIDAIAREDSDNDGVPNLVELLTGRFPGDDKDKPNDAELAELPKLFAAHSAYLKQYHWRPFETVTRPAVPAVKNAAWVRNPIDAFILAEQEARGLKPRPEANREVLLRRLTFDLTGLPLTEAELQAFLADNSPDAYEKAVDRLLASPRYGERWGRHWMDVWRYSDWAGYGAQIRDSHPHIWRWRDWIIESLNEDKPYDRMILEMLAGDEIAPTDPNTLRATGFLVRNYKLLSREKWMQETVEHTFLAFQGVTINCAKCHDHMYDPIMQREYYQLRAIFEPYQVRTDRVPGQMDTKLDGLVRIFDATLDAKTQFFIRGDERTPDPNRVITPGVPEAIGPALRPITAITLPLDAVSPDRRPFVVKGLLEESDRALEPARAKVKQAKAVWAKTHPGLARIRAAWKLYRDVHLAEADLAVALARHDSLRATLLAEELTRSEKGTPKWEQAARAALVAQREFALADGKRNVLALQIALEPLIAPGAIDAATKKLAAAEIVLKKAEEAMKLPITTAFTPHGTTTYPATSTGRRLALAQWMIDRQNPLTARVAVNQMWLRHLGQPLVPSVFDFGRNGMPPTHPALLDWLAAELMERNWKMKEMHRLIVTSAAYRQASTPDDANLAIDPDNRYYWRFAPRRLEAEAIRDSVLYVAGQLDLKMGGVELDHLQGLTIPRRSVYFRHAQEKQMEFLKIFDVATVTECYRRKESITPQHALALANSELTLRSSRIIAAMLTKRPANDNRTFTVAAFERMLSRKPTEDELKECTAFLEKQTKRYQLLGLKPAAPSANGQKPSTDPAQRARENLVHVLFNHHEFVTMR